MHKRHVLIFVLSISAVLICGFSGIYHSATEFTWHSLLRYFSGQVLPFLCAIASGAILSVMLLRCIGMTSNRNNVICCGFIIAAITPLNIPFWLAVLATSGGFIFSRVAFRAGGITHSLNAAVSARLIVFFFRLPHSVQWLSQAGADGWSGATPLQARKICQAMQHPCVAYPLSGLFTGQWSGAPGEVSKAAIIVAAIVLLLSGLIRLSPVLWGMLGFCLVWFTCQGGGADTLLQQLLMGSFLFALVFMLRNHFTGQLPAGYQCAHAFMYGALCVLFRIYGPFAEGTLLSLVVAQLMTGILLICHRHIMRVTGP
ncbi:RnfABCDGE type electron transport complex subunit D [Rahnella laticis]|uniref:RnfABCDGE type electron transport complex subunit D n=1 Tax=Rahnella laticis TaxID=2787622 RepID=UPI0018A30C1D|nr:RnfABCDGE type electron transport complex subunit D [Rahnella laticis]MBF7997496.1 RnfABCDGE type electron transport complex subunit D [Rahnella laticis]